MSNSFIMTESIVRPAKMPYGRLKDNGFVGIEGEHAARALVVETKDDLSAFASVNLIIDDLDCGAMTKTTSGSTTTLSMTLTSSMIGRSGRKICQLIMVNSGNTVVQKSSQFEAYVGRANEIERSVDDGVTIIILSEAVTEMAREAASAAAEEAVADVVEDCQEIVNAAAGSARDAAQSAQEAEEAAASIVVDATLDSTSTHAIQNKVVASEISSLKADLDDLGDDKINKDAITYLELEWTQGKYVNSSGELKTTSGTNAYATADYIPVKAGATYCTNTYAQSSFYCALYDTQKNLVGSAWQNSGEYVFTPAVDGYVRLTTNSNYVNTSNTYLIEAISPDSGIIRTEQSKTYAGMGYTDVNLINPSEVVSGYTIDTETGRLTRANAYSTSGFIPVIPGATYKFFRESSSISEKVAFYNNTLTFISALNVSNNDYYIVVPDNWNVAYMRISVSNFPQSPMLKIVQNAKKNYLITPQEGLLVGVKNAYKSMATDIYVLPGEYDIIADYEDYYGSDYFTNYADNYNGRANGAWDYGIWLENVSITFSAGAVVSAEYTGSNSYVISNFSAFAMGHNVVIDGLVLDAKNLRYGIHPDFWNDYQSLFCPSRLVIRNCNLHNYREDDNSNNQNAAIGAGFPVNGNWLIENCTIKADTNKRVIRIHNNSANGAKTHLVIRGCRIDGDGYIEVNSYGASTEMSEVLVYGCTMKRPATGRIEGSGSTENVEIYNFANTYTAEDDAEEIIHSNNWLDIAHIVTGKYIDTDGTEKTSSLDPPASYTDYYIPVAEGDVISGTYGQNTTANNLYKICAYDEDYNVLPESGLSSVATSYTVPSGVAYIKVSARWLHYSFARINKNGLNVKYQPYYVDTVQKTVQQNYNDVGNTLRYPLTNLPGYILKNLAYKPLGQLSKAYLCLVSDDGKAELASYTIPMFISKGVPGTWAVMSQSEIFDTPEQTAVVVDSVENHNCEIAMHGLYNWDSYDEFMLNQYFDQQDAFLTTKGLTAYGAVCPSHHINDMISAVAGARYGCLRTGFQYGTPYYDNYMNGARSNLYGLSCYGIIDGTLQVQKDHIDYALAHNLLCIIFWHDQTLTTEYKERLEALIDYAKTTSIEFITLKDVPTII